jgi:hypothetical protein
MWFATAYGCEPSTAQQHKAHKARRLTMSQICCDATACSSAKEPKIWRDLNIVTVQEAFTFAVYVWACKGGRMNLQM